ncbi:MAG: sn-glycerol-3-phosphate ABC transporter ATP-binding protein UgpC [Desulfarculus sp.]|nr:MAG: sn-glycerol-3-phosphate ABC transporter ATP-binding protein UgpC [Desulfarculus sp.]
MAKITLSKLTKRFGEYEAVKGIDLTIADGEFAVLVGPSGCGKSTTLRMIAGLEEITSGEITIGDTVVNDLAPKHRDIAMVFQEYALYPHMTVRKNLAFGLKMRGYKKGEQAPLVQEAANMLGISELLERKPRELSGGQRQRVALGRAIVRKPKAFLFDEPLSNLDAKLRVQMRAELSRLHRRLATTMIYVTHDQVEAMTMGTKIVIMKDGLIQQVGSPMEVYRRPLNQFVAGFIGSPAMNFFKAMLVQRAEGVYVEAASFRVPVPERLCGPYQCVLGREVIFGIRPEDIHSFELLQQQQSAILPECRADSMICGEVEVIEPLGPEMLVLVKCGDQTTVVRLDPRLDLEVGQDINLQLDMEKMHLFDAAHPHARIEAP